MTLTLNLPPEEETLFHEWAARHGEYIQREAQALSSNQKPWQTLLDLFAQASALLLPLSGEVTGRQMEPAQFLLIILQTMVALSRTDAGRFTFSNDLFPRSPLEGAMVLYDLQVLPLELAARIAGISQREFLDALGKAGIPALQYSLEEVLADVEAV